MNADGDYKLYRNSLNLKGLVLKIYAQLLHKNYYVFNMFVQQLKGAARCMIVFSWLIHGKNIINVRSQFGYQSCQLGAEVNCCWKQMWIKPSWKINSALCIIPLYKISRFPEVISRKILSFIEIADFQELISRLSMQKVILLVGYIL